MKTRIHTSKSALSVVAVLLAIVFCNSARADVVTEWKQRAQQALLTANASPIASSRALAMPAPSLSCRPNPGYGSGNAQQARA